MKEEILRLRSEGKSYNEIHKLLGCSKGSVSYHCGIGQKEKMECRQRKHRNTLKGILKRKKDNFSFVHRIKGRGRYNRREHLCFSGKEFEERLLSNPTCYLTGRPVDLFKPKTYHCDHMIPVIKGGKSTLENMGLACKEANMAKSDMTVDEFFNLCKEVLEHNGYKVNNI